MKAEVFRGRATIVTGASSGIGKELALLLARQGARVALAARRAERLEQTAQECREAGGEALSFPADVGDEAQCKALVQKTIESFGRLDLLVNNAGMAASALFDDFPDLSLFRRTMDVNFYGAPRGPRGRAFYTSRMMSAARCAEIALRAASRRKREVLMGPGGLAVWIKTLAPGLVDWLAVKAFLEPAARRLKACEAELKREAAKEGEHGEEKPSYF